MKIRRIIFVIAIAILTFMVMAQQKYFSNMRDIALEQYPNFPSTMALIMIIVSYLLIVIFTCIIAIPIANKVFNWKI